MTNGKQGTIPLSLTWTQSPRNACQCTPPMNSPAIPVKSKNKVLFLEVSICRVDEFQSSKMANWKFQWNFEFLIFCYMFLISKCRGESDLGLCMTSGFAKRMPLRKADFRFLNAFGRKIHRKSALRSGILFANPKVMHRPGSDFPPHTFRY